MGTDLRNKQHLFFDLDDTLWDFENNSAAVLCELFTLLGLEDKLKTDASSFCAVFRHINTSLWTQYYKKEMDKQTVRDRRFYLTFCHFGYDNSADSQQASAFYIGRAPYGKLLRPDCLETLDYLKGRYQLHIITNGFREVQFIKIDGCNLRPYFSTILIGEDHQLLKPDVELFRIAEKMTGALAEHCVMIGDSLECDVLGAMSAGWEAIYTGEEESDGCFRKIKRLGDLKALF